MYSSTECHDTACCMLPWSFAFIEVKYDEIPSLKTKNDLWHPLSRVWNVVFPNDGTWWIKKYDVVFHIHWLQPKHSETQRTSLSCLSTCIYHVLAEPKINQNSALKTTWECECKEGIFPVLSVPLFSIIYWKHHSPRAAMVIVVVMKIGKLRFILCPVVDCSWTWLNQLQSCEFTNLSLLALQPISRPTDPSIYWFVFGPIALRYSIKQNV